MAKVGMAGGSEPLGPGEALERRQRRRQGLILAILTVAGGVSGMVLALTEEDGASFFQGAIPSGVAIALAGFWLISVIGGSIWYKRHIDELEMAAQVWGSALGGSAALLLYPVWLLLWRGQLVPEPNAHILVGALFAVMMLGYGWKKFR